MQLAGAHLEAFLLPALARHLVYTTREDLLPEFAAYAPAMAACPAPADEDDSAIDASALFPITTKQSLDWVHQNIATHRPTTLYDALLTAAARNLLHYDINYQFAFDRPVNDNVGWLDFTHGITFGNAVRYICERYPRIWRAGLLQMAMFAGRNRQYLDMSLDEPEWFVAEGAAFFAETRESLLDHGQRGPIFSAHLLKTTLAVEEELTSPAVARPLTFFSARFSAEPVNVLYTDQGNADIEAATKATGEREDEGRESSFRAMDGKQYVLRPNKYELTDEVLIGRYPAMRYNGGTGDGKWLKSSFRKTLPNKSAGPKVKSN